jgi:hypothetical protein
VAWRGFLVGLQPMAAFVLRLFVLPWLHARNSYSISLLSLMLLICICFSYLWVATVPAMIVLRLLHGAVFVLLTSALISLFVVFIPPQRSAQGFSWITKCRRYLRRDIPVFNRRGSSPESDAEKIISRHGPDGRRSHAASEP